MCDRLVDRVHDADHHPHPQILGVPIRLGRLADWRPARSATNPFVADQLDARCMEVGEHHRQQLVGHRCVDQQGLGGVAYPRPLDLGVIGDRRAISRSASAWT